MEPDFLTSFNADSIPLIRGTPVARAPSGEGFIRASSASASRAAFGLLSTDAPIGVHTQVQLQGEFEMSDWTLITGSTLLIPLAFYWLYGAPGKLTSVQPLGDALEQIVGFPLSPLIFNITPTLPGEELEGQFGTCCRDILDGGTANGYYADHHPVDGNSANGVYYLYEVVDGGTAH